MTTTLLKPCPFCGGTQTEVTGEYGYVRRVRCNECEAQGPVETDPGIATDSWNRAVRREDRGELESCIGGASITNACAFMRCSFCLTSQTKAKRIIAGTGVFICDECVRLCGDIIEEGEDREDESQ